ncbi:MAG: discoidin domain-containing protein [Pirellulales bacterium]
MPNCTARRDPSIAAHYGNELILKNVFVAFVVCSALAGIARGDEPTDEPLKNLALHAKVVASSVLAGSEAKNAVDGKLSTRWISNSAVLSWLEIDLVKEVRVAGVHIYSGAADTAPVNNLIISYMTDGQWKDIPSGIVHGNGDTATWVKFDDSVAVKTEKLRLLVARTPDDITRIKEITVWPYVAEGFPPLGTGVTGWVKPIDQSDVPLIYLNQSGFDLNRPKRFTAPTLIDGTPFIVRQKNGKEALFTGKITGHRGDFSAFNPESDAEYVVEAGGHTSFPFRIGPYWLERATYQDAVNFMIDSRHYVGTSTTPIGNSIGWRDDCHFAFEVNTLVAQYLSNPTAYERMPKQVHYQQPPKPGLWGTLEPYHDDAPDVVKLIHWGTDLIVSQKKTHEMLKEQLAYFLYAWPWLKQWLPEQNYEVVSEFAFDHWGDATADTRYAFDKSPEHDLFAVKSVLGTTKGELPPGHSVQPNLLMYEVAKREGRKDAEKYFNAAFAQAAWMIANLDWNDPQTTKGQRASEHVTMTGLAHFLAQYPDRVPAGLQQKIIDWARIMVSRSDNMWDFRKLTDESDWVPSGEAPTMWNEPGNVVGFPACAAAAMEVIDDPQLNERLLQLVYSHMDNAFGRNPTGRAFSHDAPREVEGVDIGWYIKVRGGVGQLGDARFVLEGAPKREHYPYNPSVGNVGWTEGWIEFNTAYNASLAAMAYRDTKVRLTKKRDAIAVDLRAPLNFDYQHEEPIALQVESSNGDTETVTLKENGAFAEEFVGILPTVIGDAEPGDGILQIRDDGCVETSYGYGYLTRRSKIQLGRPATAEKVGAKRTAGNDF